MLYSFIDCKLNPGKSLKTALINASFDAKLNAENIRPGSLIKI